MPENVCNVDVRANELLASLTAGEDFEFPDVNLGDIGLPGGMDNPIFQEIARLTNADLTEVTIEGKGTFDLLMRAFKAHLAQEFEKGRITGAEYSKTYIALSQGAMSQAVQFLLGRDQAFWQAQAAQIGALTALVQLEIAKAQYAAMRFEALNNKAQYARTKMGISNDSADFCIKQFSLNNMLPAQLELVNEQIESQRAQTQDGRTDGAPITGVLGKQKELYSQQITSYQRDAEVKSAKMFVDAWITQKTIDEGLLPPEGFENDNLDKILAKLMENNGFGAMISD